MIPVLSAGALFGFGCSPSKKVVEVPKVSLEKVVHYDFGDLGKLNIEDGFFEAQDFLTRVNVCEKGSLSDTRVNDWKTIAGFVNNSVNYDGKMFVKLRQMFFLRIQIKMDLLIWRKK
ncbi:hypothetical protein J4481_02515 [Candidatus Pacearchaeota archaeon]|nr:hypothetical protein [Candidatus Pacearchaeota archaeon]